MDVCHISRHLVKGKIPFWQGYTGKSKDKDLALCLNADIHIFTVHLHLLIEFKHLSKVFKS